MPSRKTKICPFCREEIDLLALKCVHCGERVGQPLGVERTLTEDDIGRPTDRKEEISDSIIAAYQRLKDSDSLATPETGPLQPLASRPQQPSERQIRWSLRLRTFGYGALALATVVVLYMIATGLAGTIRRMPNSRRASDAEALLAEAASAERMGDLIGAMKLGNDALVIYSGDPEAEKFVEELRQRLIDKAYDLLEQGDLEYALQFCTDAIEADPTNTRLPILRSDISKEIQRSKLVLKAVSKGEAQFLKPDGSQVMVKVGGVIADLGFKLKSVDFDKSTAVVYDQKRERDLLFRVRSSRVEVIKTYSSEETD